MKDSYQIYSYLPNLFFVHFQALFLTIISYQGSLQFYQNTMPAPAPMMAPPMMPQMFPMSADMMYQVLPAITRMFNQPPSSHRERSQSRKRYKSSSESEESDKPCACDCMTCSGSTDCCRQLCTNCGDQNSVVFVPFPYPVPVPPPSMVPQGNGLVPVDIATEKNLKNDLHDVGTKAAEPTELTSSTPTTTETYASEPPMKLRALGINNNCKEGATCNSYSNNKEDLRQGSLPVRKLDKSIFDFNNEEYKMPPKKFIDELVNAEMDMLEEERKLRNLLSNFDNEVQH